MAKQVSEILVKLGIQGAEGLDKLKSSFRELEKALGPSAATIERARESIIAFGKEGKNTEQLIKGQIEALRGLQSQTERGSAAWAELADDIERFRQASRKTDGEIQVLRQSILSVASGTDQSQKSLREYIGDLSRLRSEATITGGTFQELSRDIAALTGRLQEAEQQTQKTSRAFGSVLGQALASTSAGLRRQLDGIKELINEQREVVNSIDLLSKKERELADNQEKRAAAQERLNRALVQQRQLQYAESIRAGRETVRVGAAAFNDPNFLSFERIRQQYGDLPDTTAGLNQELTELSERLLNTTRGSNLYVETANRMAEIQRQLRTELTGTAEAFRRLGIAQDGVERRAGKLADIQEYYRTQGPLAPGVGGYRDPVTGAMIMAGARTPGRIRVEESAYPTPIGPQPFPEAGRRAQEQIQQSLDDVNRIYEDARIRRVEIQTKYDQIHIDKLLEGLELEGQVRDKGFRDELAAFDRQLEARDRKRRRRLTTGQAVQSAGAIISGGIFGGPEGLLGGLGGFAAGLAIPGLGPVGGAFAGAAGGAQVGAIRQQLGAFAEQAAEISKLRRGLAGVSVDLKDFEEALQATQRASDSLLLPLGQTIRFYTQLRASTVELNYSAEDTRQVLEGTASAVLKTGGSLDDVNGAMRAVIQILSKGKVSAEELRGQLGERLPGAVIKFAQENKISVQELDRAFESGSVTLEQFFNFARKNYEDGAKYANDMAAGTEFAGQRMEKALERLRLAIGSRLKESGAGFQNFVTEVVDSLLWAGRELERFGAKVETFLGSRQFGVSGSSQQIAERIIGGGLSVQDLENAIKAYEGKIAEVEKRFRTQGQRNVFQQLFDATFGEGTVTENQLSNAKAFYLDLIKKLQAAREQAEKATRDGKGGADGANQNAEDLKERQKLGEKYLQALEQREEALANARLQREEQIAQIRKNAIEQAFQIERQLADERRNIERDMERVRREMQYGAEEIDRLRRLAEGEDPAVIEAERKAAEISQRATEDKIKIQEDYLDKEIEQQRTIADFQKNTAKQIADANQAYAKRVGEIQKDFAKESAKIIEEGSGAAARRITLAAQIVSQVLQRSAVNQLQVNFGKTPISEPIGFKKGKPVYAEGGDVPEQIKRIDIILEQLLRKLVNEKPAQSSLPAGRRVSSLGIGEQFLGMLGAESGYEDVAGLLPLPIQRMQQQAARPLRMIWQKIQGTMEGVYGATEKQIKETFKPDPLRNSKVLQRIQQTQEAILNWDPLQAQWKETQNQLRQTKRSKPASMPLSSFVTTAQQMRDSASEVARKAGGLAAPAGARLGSQLDFSDYLSEQQKRILVTGIKEVLNSAMDASFQELRNSAQRQRDPSLMPSFEKATSQIQGLLPSFRAVIQEALSQEAVKGQRYAMDAMKKFGMPAPVDPGFYRSLLYEDPSRAQERLRELGPLNEPPRIIHGVEGLFEGAMLPGRGFDISRMTQTLGNVATASTASLAGYFPSIAQAIPGAAPTTQLRQQGAQQQIQQVDQQALIQSYQVLSEIKTSSQQTLDNYKLQNREIDLQIQALTEGVEPAIAEEFSGLQANYELQQQQLELRKQALIASGQNAEAVNQAYAAESTALARIYEQNQAAIVQYQQKRKVLEQIQNASSILESNLTNAISSSIQVLVTGSGTVKEVLADMFESIGQAFIQMAAQIIAKQLVMVALGSILKALGISGGTSSGGTSFGSSYFDPATGLGNAGPNFGLAKGGVVDQNGIQPFATGGIVTRPTFFKYAKGGEMQNGLMGEAGPEAIMPLKRGADGKLGVTAKLDGAMGRYRRSPGSAGGPAGGGVETESGAAAAMTQPIDVRYNVERINQVDYVTADQFQAGMRQAAAQGAKQGEQRALNSLRQNTTTRRKVGI